MRHRKIEQDIASRGGVEMERATAADTYLPGDHLPPYLKPGPAVARNLAHLGQAPS